MKTYKIVILVFVVFQTLMLSQSVLSQNQSGDLSNGEVKKFEVGGHFTVMFQDDFNPADITFKRFGFNEAVITDRRYESGFGGRFTYNINRNLAVEGEVNFIPSIATINERAKNGSSTNLEFPGGEKLLFLGGIKYGVRRSKYGVFGKARPGAIRFNAFPKIVNRVLVPSPTGNQPSDLLIIQTEAPATFFNIDVGGVFEYYPTRKIIFRVDVGDTIIRYSRQEPREINPSFTRHNLQISAGFGFRF